MKQIDKVLMNTMQPLSKFTVQLHKLIQENRNTSNKLFVCFNSNTNQGIIIDFDDDYAAVTLDRQLIIRNVYAMFVRIPLSDIKYVEIQMKPKTMLKSPLY